MKIILGGNVGKLILKHSPGNNFEVFLQQQVKNKPSSRARAPKKKLSSSTQMCQEVRSSTKGAEETI